MVVEGPSRRIISEPIEPPVTPGPVQPDEPEPAPRPPLAAPEPEPATPT